MCEQWAVHRLLSEKVLRHSRAGRPISVSSGCMDTSSPCTVMHFITLRHLGCEQRGQGSTSGREGSGDPRVRQVPRVLFVTVSKRSSVGAVEGHSPLLQAFSHTCFPRLGKSGHRKLHFLVKGEVVGPQRKRLRVNQAESV